MSEPRPVFFLAERHFHLSRHQLACDDGVSAFTKEFLSQGLCPERLRVHFNYRSEPTEEQLHLLGLDARTSLQGQIELYVYRDYHAPLWIQHSNCIAAAIDVVLLRFNPDEVGINPQRIVCVNDYGFHSLHHMTGADVLIIGFPLSEPGLKFPVWKKGSIASELLIPWRQKPAFLIDCRTSKGMSGSPVIRRSFGPVTTSDMTMNLDAVVTSEFMGVYSGRLHDNENLASIGIVWWRTVIHEILLSPCPGDRGAH